MNRTYLYLFFYSELCFWRGNIFIYLPIPNVDTPHPKAMDEIKILGPILLTNRATGVSNGTYVA